VTALIPGSTFFGNAETSIVEHTGGSCREKTGVIFIDRCKAEISFLFTTVFAGQ
jgi:hypothetical protein